MGRARIATICLASRGYPSVEENRRYALKLIDEALKVEPDLVCFPEAFTTFTVRKYRSIDDLAEEVTGPTVEAFSKKAIEYNSYIICPIITRHDGKIWNSAIVIGRSGEVIGVYDKVHPVTSTYDYTVFEDGVTPGGDYPVFDLDFGRIGIQICFDICFPEGWNELARRGAKMVFWVSAYNGGFPLQAYASINRYYIVSSVRTDRSMIIDPCGRILAETDSIMNVAYYDVSLDYTVCHHDFNYSIPDLILDKYGDKVRIRSYRDDALFIVECMDESIKVDDLQKELGFESFQQYIDRHRYAYKCIYDGRIPPPQKATHGSRPPYQKWL
ncbi:MAG: carbon-nitrogen hydrolase family protein [Nitrososphaerota archaeon]|nr:carbon-nitrogen hydrolase family protein [Candidatus Bathyarchaeota archaeon]MDW8062101.1 carbon-nitrogen hydrolase family protein [Nitrososphaerota archaeon]